MVRNYKKKDAHMSWNELSMAKAIESVISREMGYTLASQVYGVPRSTLRRRIRSYQLNSDMEFASSKGIYNKKL